MTHDLEELEKRISQVERIIAKLEWDFERHLEVAKELIDNQKEVESWKESVNRMFHTGRSLVVAVRIILLGIAVLGIFASHGFWAAFLRLFGPGK